MDFKIHAEFCAGNSLAHDELVGSGFADYGAAFYRRGSDAWIIHMKGLAIAQRNRWQVRQGWRWQKRNRAFWRIDASVPRKGDVRPIQVLIIEIDLITTVPEVVMQEAQHGAINGHEWAVKLQSEVVVCDRLENIVHGDVVQGEIARGFAPEVDARQQ